MALLLYCFVTRLLSFCEMKNFMRSSNLSRAEKLVLNKQVFAYKLAEMSLKMLSNILLSVKARSKEFSTY